MTSAASPVRDAAWIERHVRAAEHASVVDVSWAYAVLGVMGPRSRELLGGSARADLSDRAFPFSTSQEIPLGYATARATRITYVGELGWELYVPTEFAVGVYEDLMAAGVDLGLADAGYYAINSLRLDKGYRAFGTDLTPDHTPLEAGLRFACKLATPIDFVGRAALESAIERVPGVAWSPSGSDDPTSCCGAANSSSVTVNRLARSLQRRGQPRAGRPWVLPTSGAATVVPSSAADVSARRLGGHGGRPRGIGRGAGRSVLRSDVGTDPGGGTHRCMTGEGPTMLGRRGPESVAAADGLNPAIRRVAGSAGFSASCSG